MADFPTTAALLTKTSLETVTVNAQTTVFPMANYVATGSGTNSSAQGFEHARAQHVEWFIDPTVTTLDQLTVIVQTSDDATTWFDLDEESLVLADATEVTNMPSLRFAAPVGSRQNRYMRLAFSSSTVAASSDFAVSARVAGINTIFTKS